MADQTEIAWCDSTFNSWIGCTKVSPACDNCYAEADFDLRRHRVKWGAGQPRDRTSPSNWKQPLRWNAKPFYECPGCGWRGDDPTKRPRCPTCDQTHLLKPARRRVFCASLADVFDNEVPGDWRRDLFALIDATPNLDWLLLTKRIGNAAAMAGAAMWPFPWPRNVWLGATICNQAEADRDIPKLLAAPARVRFLSMEPLLGAIDLRNVAVPEEHDQLRRPWDFEGYKFNALQDHDDDRFHQAPATLDWIIVGGESGPKARPMHPDWVRGLRDQCAAAGVPFLFKQWGEFAPYDRSRTDGASLETKNSMDMPMQRIGKKIAGRLLDGVLHDGYPEARP